MPLVKIRSFLMSLINHIDCFIIRHFKLPILNFGDKKKEKFFINNILVVYTYINFSVQFKCPDLLKVYHNKRTQYE